MFLNKQKKEYSSGLNTALAIPVVLTLLILLFFRSQPSSSLQNVMLATGDWAPYSGEQLNDYGIASVIVSSVMSEAGYDTTMQFMAWSKAYEVAVSSKFNQGVRGTFPWYKTSDRQKDFYYSNPLLEIDSTIFYDSRKTPELEAHFNQTGNLNEYNGLRIESYEYHPDIKKMLTESKEVPSTYIAFQKLINNSDIHYLSEAKDVGESILREYFSNQQAYIKSFEQQWPNNIHLLASKKNPNNRQLIERFNKALAQMKRSGNYDIILETAKHQIDVERAVNLHPFNVEGYIEGYYNPTGKESILLADGTRAVVEKMGGQVPNSGNVWRSRSRIVGKGTNHRSTHERHYSIRRWPFN